MMSPKEGLTIDNPMTPPYWALLEQDLLRTCNTACRQYFDHYFDDRGYLLCIPRWGALDGPDDAIQSLQEWTILHALGGHDSILDMYRKGWEGHLRQYTEAKTVEVPLGRDGMYYKEFPAVFDWLHNGESMSVFNLEGLSDPYDPSFQQRVKRYAGLYMNEDPQAPNYDPKHKIIRSMFNGSRGPLLRKTTAMEWAGDPIEVEGRFIPGHGVFTYQDMLDRYQEYTDTIGDHPLNLRATTLALNAYMLTHEPRYKDWLLEYIDAWVERTEENNGIIPTNIGLDGKIGSACDGKWYGGVFGWGFTVKNAVTGEMDHRRFWRFCQFAFGNALLVTGDQRYVNLWRRMIDAINGNQKEEEGRTLYPHMYGDQGWYDYTQQPFDQGALEVYYWSMDRDDLGRVQDNEWISYLEGSRPEYPVEALLGGIERVRSAMERMREDTGTQDTRLSDEAKRNDPAAVMALVQLMQGGIPTGSAGYPLHCRLRYFDPVRRRPGLPENVSALVEKMTDSSVTLTLINVDPVQRKTVILQGGAYGEHRIVSLEMDKQKIPIDKTYFSIQIAPGAGARMVIKMRRFSEQPTLAFPWV